MIDLTRARSVAVAAAEEAGAVLAPGARFSVQAKGHDDLVTDLDHRAEGIILGRLRDAFPDHAVLAEESGRSGDGDALWVVDPLDGTHNLAIGLPAYSVGIALCLDGAPVLGVVHDPVTRLTWSAVRGDGPRGPGDVPLATEPDRPGSAPIVSYVQGYPVGRTDPTALAYKHVLGARSRRLLQLWSPQLTWIMLARGVIDAVIGYRTGAVDLPAGALIATEAGAVLTALDGGPFELSMEHTEYSFIAARPGRVAPLVALLAEASALELPPLS
ncbi:inositol monophosphatase family protein [Actinocorallia populi]|uniref:inositol monophosphatase family protein n=1 Tax=Actinocorallia populi TaxID=2079200 RepID=UPI000D08A861|nr:inositol monophosphatase [Actinocorallia populi]